MSNRIKFSLIIGSAMALMMCLLLFLSTLSGEVKSADDEKAALATAIGAGLLTAVVCYFFYGKLADKFFGNKNSGSKFDH